MKIRLLVLLFAALVICTGCRRGQPILIQTVDFASATDSLTPADVRLAILQGCAAKDWMASEVSPGIIEARLQVRGKHTVEVSIPYTDSGYAIRYKDSVNMEYKRKKNGTEVIHPNYARWVAYLEQAINVALTERRNMAYEHAAGSVTQ